MGTYETLTLLGGIVSMVIAIAAAASARTSANAAEKQAGYAERQAEAATAQASAAQTQLRHQELANVISQFAFWKNRIDQAMTAVTSLAAAERTLSQIGAFVLLVDGKSRALEITHDLIANNLLNIPVKDCSPDQIISRATNEVDHLKMLASEWPLSRTLTAEEITRVDGLCRSCFAALAIIRDELPDAANIQKQEMKQAARMLDILQTQLDAVHERHHPV